MLTLSLAALTLGLAAITFEGTTVSEKEPIVISEVVDCGSVAQAELFRRARIWLAQTNPERETLVADKESGDLVAPGSLSLVVPRSETGSGGVFQIKYVLTIECVNRKYRATISEIGIQDNAQGKATPVHLYASRTEADTNAFRNVLEIKLKAVLAGLQKGVKGYEGF